jgi:hypothetical protein
MSKKNKTAESDVSVTNVIESFVDKKTGKLQTNA